jgi:thioredoxin-related protein
MLHLPGLFLLLLLLPLPAAAGGDFTEPDGFSDAPVLREIVHPEWFKEDSFLNLSEDLQEALQGGKRGLVLYFGQANCAYCKQLMEVNFRNPEIVRYFRARWDIIPLDIWGSRSITLFDGEQLSENELATFEETKFTPSLIFYDAEGRKIYRMRGYYPPYRFMALLRYLGEGFYRKERFSEYLDRANPPPKFDEADLNELVLALSAPHILDRRGAPAQKPLLVLFEESRCHACDQLHSAPLEDPVNRRLLEHFEIHQLDGRSDTPLVTPEGERTTAGAWARQLGVNYFPTLLFFDERGRELFRIDSVVRLYRLRGVLAYMLDRGYDKYPTY